MPCKIWISLHFLSFKIDCVHRTSGLSHRLVAAAVQTRRLVAAMCRSHLSHRVSRALTLAKLALADTLCDSWQTTNASAGTIPRHALTNLLPTLSRHNTICWLTLPMRRPTQLISHYNYCNSSLPFCRPAGLAKSFQSSARYKRCKECPCDVRSTFT